MSYKIGQKVIIHGQLFKIKRIETDGIYTGCNEKGCSSIIVEPNIRLSYIGEADPEITFSAKTFKNSAAQLLSQLTNQELCELGCCDDLQKSILIAEKIIEKFQYKVE